MLSGDAQMKGMFSSAYKEKVRERMTERENTL